MKLNNKLFFLLCLSCIVFIVYLYLGSIKSHFTNESEANDKETTTTTSSGNTTTSSGNTTTKSRENEQEEDITAFLKEQKGSPIFNTIIY